MNFLKKCELAGQLQRYKEPSPWDLQYQLRCGRLKLSYVRCKKKYIPNVEGPIGNNPECEIYFVPIDETKQWGHQLLPKGL